MRWHCLLLSCLTTWLISTDGYSNEVSASLAVRTDRSTFFASESFVRTCEVHGASDGSRVVWKLTTDSRTLSRGEQAVGLRENAPWEVKINLQMPSLRDHVALPVEFQVELINSSREILAKTRQFLWVFSQDPFASRNQWLEDLQIVLYDPIGDTSRVFDKAGIPYRYVRGLSALQATSDGLVVVGENAPFGDPSALFQVLSELASRGRRIISLATNGGTLRLPENGTVSSAPAAFILRQSDVIHDFDKRLDAEVWGTSEPIARSVMRLTSRRDQVVLAIQPAGDGWPWAEFRYPNGGKLILCNFPIISSWSIGPTPRYLLSAILTANQGAAIGSL